VETLAPPVFGKENLYDFPIYFIIFDRIKTKYSTDNKYGDFAKAYGSKLFIGYRMYF